MEWNIFKRSNNQNAEVILPQEPTATSLIFGGYALNEAATSLSAFFGAKELITNSIAQLPILIKRENKIDNGHPLNFIFRNTLMSKYAFMKMMIDDVIMHGNAYAYIQRATDGTPISLIYCEYGSCNHHYNRNTQDLYYRASFIRKGKIEPIDIIHFYKNSYNGVEGQSLISFANLVLSLSKATDKAARKYYSNGCALQGALTIKGARKGAKEQARQAFQNTHGDKGSGLVILDDDMTYTPLSSNANDSQMIEARSFNVDEIARYFNISPVLLGDLSNSSYNTIEAANIEFVTHTLMPYISMVQEEFNRKLVKPSEYGVIEIDLDETFLLKGDKNTTATYLKTLVSGGIMTINEAREHLGLPKVDGCDDLIIPFTNINDNMINKIEEEIEDGENI